MQMVDQTTNSENKRSSMTCPGPLYILCPFVKVHVHEVYLFDIQLTCEHRKHQDHISQSVRMGGCFSTDECMCRGRMPFGLTGSHNFCWHCMGVESMERVLHYFSDFMLLPREIRMMLVCISFGGLLETEYQNGSQSGKSQDFVFSKQLRDP